MERPRYIASLCFVCSALFDTTSRALGGSRRTALARVTGISPLRGSLRAAPRPVAVTGQEYHYQIAGGVGPDKPATMRNGPPQAAFGTDGYRSAPSLAVFDAGSRPHRWSSRILPRRSSPFRGLPPADVSRCRICNCQGSRRSPVDHRYSQYRANWARMLFMIWRSVPLRAVFIRRRSFSCSGDNTRLSR